MTPPQVKGIRIAVVEPTKITVPIQSTGKLFGQHMTMEGNNTLTSLDFGYHACRDEVEAVRLLLQYDTSVTYAVDKEGQSALYIAAIQGRVNIIWELLRHCPDAGDIISTKG